VAERILGYKFEKALGFCTKEAGCGAYIPLYRFYNPIAKGKGNKSRRTQKCIMFGLRDQATFFTNCPLLFLTSELEFFGCLFYINP
jgi:hypothetical protein